MKVSFYQEDKDQGAVRLRLDKDDQSAQEILITEKDFSTALGKFELIRMLEKKSILCGVPISEFYKIKEIIDSELAYPSHILTALKLGQLIERLLTEFRR